MVAKREFTIAHSPDADDAFMFYALATGKIESDLLEFRHVLKDIQTLNQDARAGRYDMTAISYHAYPYVSDRYVLTAAGSSVGDGYGPIVVARPGLAPGSLAGSRVAVPGLMTTAYLALKLYEPHIEPVVYDFDAILEAVAGGEVDAGVVIHEGQLTFADTGLRSVADLGEWWQRTQGLPLPLGCNCILRDLPVEVQAEARKKLSETIRYSLDHRGEALEYALQFSRGLETGLADRFVGMYVNGFTTEMAPSVLAAGQRLLDMGHSAGLIPRSVQLEYI
ncbi:MAG: ABC transporter substrate-binding protein [Bryobacterales bacterium]|nr:ABC transporter substrate-binding protein [Bryobacterales bacterium]